jgi:hypothetical protein
MVWSNSSSLFSVLSDRYKSQEKKSSCQYITYGHALYPSCQLFLLWLLFFIIMIVILVLSSTYSYESVSKISLVSMSLSNRFLLLVMILKWNEFHDQQFHCTVRQTLNDWGTGKKYCETNILFHRSDSSRL